ncbi:MAG: outer membrane protein heavy metal efflux system [Betaproteobacteria bacterium]|jgi:cobalt-zinc-cadmium efflux system outer membrane protein|nr:outer membrane protein heavy metal efflux system [Betaproteobacteria bacterium]
MWCSVFAEPLVSPHNFGMKRPSSVYSGLWGALLPLASFLLLTSVSPAARGAEIERLTLQQARLLMLERNRELQLARHAVSGAEADITIAGAPPNPILTLSTARIGPADQDTSPLIRRIDAGVGVTQLFERGRKRELRTEAARFAYTAAQNDQVDVERQQRIAVDQAYYDLLLAQEKQLVAEEGAGLFDKTIEAAERRVQAGDLSRADLARLSVDALRARNEVDNARLEQIKAQVTLAYLIGLERDAQRIRAAESWPPIAIAPALPEIERVVAQRADVQAAQARIQQADKNRALAQALRTRDITAGVQYDHAPTDVVRNSVGLNVSVPLFTRYYFQGEIRRAESDYLASQTALERVRAAAISQVSGAAGALGSAAERVRRFQERLLAAAEQAASGAEFAYTRGAIGVMDLLDARRQLHVTRLEYASALADYARANSVWLAATETPKPAP